MPPDSTTYLEILLGSEQWTLVNVVTIIGVFAAIIGAFYAYLPYHQQRRRQKLIEREFGADFYLPEEIERATRYYIRPNGSSVDPGQEAEMRQVEVFEGPLFEKMDQHLATDSPTRHLLLLADSGMGKSSFVLNYYAYNRQRPRKKRHRIAVVPLGIQNADGYIEKIENKRNTVLFLDAFDEDTRAIEDHRKRLHELMKKCQKFKRVLLTCRTQFFLSNEEIPKETGIARVSPVDPGQKGGYEFWKLYLAPLNDNQVEMYLQKRYPIWRWKERRKALRLVKKIPLLSVRPMLLAYIPDIMKSDQSIRYSHELYQEMVEAWLTREEGKLGVEKEPLRRFSEQLAVDIYINREIRESERIPREQVVTLARAWGIEMEVWKLTGRSLLNRDAVGKCKFSHRSIMEYLVVRQFVKGNKDCRNLAWSDQMQRFLWEMLQPYTERQEKPPFELIGADLSLYQLKLRHVGEAEFSEEAVKRMLRERNLFDRRLNKSGRGIAHIYQVHSEKDGPVVMDFITGLMWQQSGSSRMTYASAKKYLDKLNEEKFAGYNDWRLPTLAEGMSLMEKEALNGDLYIDPLFAKTQRWIWTSDQSSASAAWVVFFGSGFCFGNHVDGDFCVRAVRSGR